MPPRSSASSDEPRPRGRPWLTAVAVALFAAITAVAVVRRGLFLSRDWLFAWILVALLVLSLGDLRRWARGVTRDWLPLMAVLLLYDLSEGVRQLLGTRPHVLPQLDADRLLGGSTVPTVALQRALYLPGHPHWYDYATFAVYLSHFFVTLLVAVALWRFAHDRFGRFRTLVVALATAGFATYVLFPAVPPWLAAYDGYLPTVHRTVGEMWQHVGLAPASALFETRKAFYNEVAALPSLHAAYPVLLLLFFWRAGPLVRVGIGAYALAMAFTLVYIGEHYVSDIVVGWAYAVATFAAVSAAWRMAERRAPGAALSPARAA